MRRVLSAVSAFILFASAASAQGPGGPGAGGPPPAQGEVRGSVVDADAKTPVARASVAVRSPQGVLITGAIANADGSFRIQGLRPGTYVLRVTYIGYGPKTQEFAVTPDAPTLRAAISKALAQ